jgi:hypothetical protein
VQDQKQRKDPCFCSCLLLLPLPFALRWTVSTQIGNNTPFR